MDATNVTASKPNPTGAIFSAPLGTKLPTDAVTALDPAFKNLGYVSEEGVTNSNSPTSDKQRAWGGDVVLNFATDRPDTFKFMLLETLNVDVLKVIYGDDNVKGTLESGISVDVGNADYENRSWVVDMIQKNVVRRIVIPTAKITALGDIVYADNKASGYDLTLSAEPISAGKYHHEYIKATATTGTGS